jgi:hypothetical protein
MDDIASATTEPDEHEEIAVTEEMVRAGRRAFAAFSVVDLVDGWQSAEELVLAVFSAMAQAGGLAPVVQNVRCQSHRKLISFESAGRFLR